LSSGPWTSGKLLTLTEVRHVHRSSRRWVDEYRRDRYATLRLPRKRRGLKEIGST